ncbi:IclR family transcriptional regulator [Oceanicola sp. D3]|uniref:IclR family transcriptional regulator n=1 Tax=Oceanicola sp. D3 TaxID=2587163 RepID=UPI001120E77B|nr:IclR family transcriptional regulator [Oceanicola sp. D3]QDC11245.1 IclR family transcriptional regulator [Oceanicola sp. D3]
MAEGLSSLDAALGLLNVLSRQGGPVGLSEIARAADMPASKAHRYLASFISAGLVSQAGRSGKYDLGPEAVALGVAGMARVDLVNRTADALPELVEETGLTALLSVWGNAGAVVVRWERAPRFVVTTLGLGTVMPLKRSASGRAFLGWAPEAVIAARLAEEGGDGEGLREAIRRAGFAAVSGELIPGLAAIAAPVLDWQGEIEAAVTLYGTDPAICAADGPEVTALRAFCAGLSAV